MIRVQSITITEFRGIRDLTLNLKGKSFAICGANGTGKSGVVDALEFALTGNVSRLSGEGTGDVSIKQQAPHVDSKDNPSAASVKLQVAIPSLNKTATIERTPADPAVMRVTPKDPAIMAVLRQVAAHPEIVLSRRELIRYVLATPGKRSEEVQALLHLDQLGQVRAILQKIANKCNAQLRVLETAASDAQANLVRALGIGAFKVEELLAAANVRRASLGLSALTDFTAITSLKEGMSVPPSGKPQRIPKAQALAEIQTASDALEEVATAATKARVAELAADLTVLANDAAVTATAKREAFFSTGLELLEMAECPFCDTQWDIERLKSHILSKIEHLGQVSRKRKAAEVRIRPLIQLLRKLQVSIDTFVSYGALAKPPIPMSAAADYSSTCDAAAERLTSLLPLAETIKVLRSVPSVPQSVLQVVAALQRAVTALPDPTKRDAAREWLTLAQERLEVGREARRKEKAARSKSQTAQHVYRIYAATSDRILTGIYAAVEKEFESLYASVHRDDESKFQAHLVPSLGKLGFDVDFYGRGFFPPGAYHSEGHQDSMGLCLYLAIMRHLQGSAFTVAVLDDVLMSVDATHRREVCALLKRQFPDTQFPITTHDPIWLRHMRTEGLVAAESSVHFRTWSVDLGPTRWDDLDVWKEIRDDLKVNDVRAAAALLRHYLEYISQELCHRLGAPVQFRGDAHYQLGDLLPPAIARMRKLYRTAIQAAKSWGQSEEVEQIAKRELEFASRATASNAEQWQVNAAVHYNSWASLGREDFAPVTEAYQALLAGFTCPGCGGFLRVSPERETADAVRCACGKTNINLRSK